MDVINHRGSRDRAESCVNTKMIGRATAHLKASIRLKCVVASAFLAYLLSAAYGAEVTDSPNQANSGGAAEFQRNWPGGHPAIYPLAATAQSAAS
jgi:hypothetical protein